jgi:hypothetical protein
LQEEFEKEIAWSHGMKLHVEELVASTFEKKNEDDFQQTVEWESVHCWQLQDFFEWLHSKKCHLEISLESPSLSLCFCHPKKLGTAQFPLEPVVELWGYSYRHRDESEGQNWRNRYETDPQHKMEVQEGKDQKVSPGQTEQKEEHATQMELYCEHFESKVVEACFPSESNQHLKKQMERP